MVIKFLKWLLIIEDTNIKAIRKKAKKGIDKDCRHYVEYTPGQMDYLLKWFRIRKS